MQPLVNHVLAGTAHVLRDRRAELVLDQLYVGAQRAADEARGSGEEAGIREEDRACGEERVARLRAVWP